ncbi:MAG TPA: helix-turn-helix transcriptional regulator [Solirubrobacterales bacterium]|jgi:transcriptional regulator with XRE-family HTH domain|nr:helix-turn-helix transcriptional regulator [Solirubrobacterales bacterium]
MVGSPLAPASAVSLIYEILGGSELSQAELARRAGIPRSVLNAYLKGTREPGADALLRIAAAGGMSLQVNRRQPPVDANRASEILVQVLELAEALPFRPRAETQFPPLAQRLSKETVAA